MIKIKTPAELEIMKEAGRISARALRLAREAAAPGMSTAELDAIAEAAIREEGAIPAFKGYGGFPASICASINDEVVHGIPSKQIKLCVGDVLTIDVGAVFEGFFGDNADTFGVGDIDEDSQRLIDTTRRGLYAGIAKCVIGNTLGDVSTAIGACAEAERLGIVREYVGHGIGRAMHEDPNVPNYGTPGTGPALKAGMVFAIEPMFNLGGDRVRTRQDGWTVVTVDGKRSAQIEHTVAVTEAGPLILTQEPGRKPH